VGQTPSRSWLHHPGSFLCCARPGWSLLAGGTHQLNAVCMWSNVIMPLPYACLLPLAHMAPVLGPRPSEWSAIPKKKKVPLTVLLLFSGTNKISFS